MIELDALKDIVPRNQRGLVTQELVDKLNEWNEDPKLMDTYKENIMSYVGVLRDGKYKLTDYIHAVKYVSYKMMGFSDIDAYAITFPDRYQKLVDEGISRSDMSPYTSAYKKNKLVNAIIEQTLIPSHILNAPLHQQALNELAQIMVYGKSEMARVNAANAILGATKAPEAQKIELEIGVKKDSAIADLRKATEELMEQQKLAIMGGSVSVAQVAASTIIEADIEE